MQFLDYELWGAEANLCMNVYYDCVRIKKYLHDREGFSKIKEFAVVAEQREQSNNEEM